MVFHSLMDIHSGHISYVAIERERETEAAAAAAASESFPPLDTGTPPGEAERETRPEAAPDPHGPPV
jgi:hypothetical protein